MNQGAPCELVAYAPEHLDELNPMWRASFEKAVGIIDPHPIEEQRNYFLTEVEPRYSTRVALLDGRLVGFAAASPESLIQLYVHVDFQRRGLGTALLDWAKRQSGGSLWLHTFERNTAAQRFYEAHGFTIVERGFEEFWQLEDIKYVWERAGRPIPHLPLAEEGR